MQINHIQKAIDCKPKLFSLFCFLPVRGTFHRFEGFVDELFQEVPKAEVIDGFVLEILPGEGELEKESTEDRNEHKKTYDRLEDPTNIRCRIKEFVILSSINYCFC
jgi:hypothetical protein